MSQIPIIDRQSIPGSCWCGACKRAKPARLFTLGRTCCKQCVRLRDNENRRGKPRKRDLALEAMKRQAYRATPEGKAAAAAYRSTLRGRLSHQLGTLRWRLKKAETPAQRVRLRGLIEQVTAELAKARAAQE